MGGMQGEVQEGGDICRYIAESLCSAAETNTTIVKQQLLFSSSHLRVTNYSRFILNELFLNKALSLVPSSWHTCEIVINMIILEYNYMQSTS